MDGLRVDRHCGVCGETTTFYEKELRRTFRLYFIDVFDYARDRVMACGGCGTHYITDELARRERREGAGVTGREGLPEKLPKALAEAPQTIGKSASEIGEGLGRAVDDVSRGLGRAADVVSEGAKDMARQWAGGRKGWKLPAYGSGSAAAREPELSDAERKGPPRPGRTR